MDSAPLLTALRSLPRVITAWRLFFFSEWKGTSTESRLVGGLRYVQLAVRTNMYAALLTIHKLIKCPNPWLFFLLPRQQDVRWWSTSTLNISRSWTTNWVKKHVIDAQSEKVTHFKSSTRDSDCNRANLGPYHEAKDVYNEPQARLCHVV